MRENGEIEDELNQRRTGKNDQNDSTASSSFISILHQPFLPMPLSVPYDQRDRIMVNENRDDDGR